MIKIAVCDDEVLELKKVNDLITKYKKEHPQYEMSIVTFSAPMEMLCYIENKGDFNIYILDVYMAGMLGTNAAREIRKLNRNGDIIFITSSRDHAIDAFEVDAMQYFIKPYTERAFFEVLDKVFSRMNVERRHMITLKSTEGTVCIFSRDVVYTESGRNNYQIIHTIRGEKIELRITSSVLFDLLSPGKSFVKCGSSINLNLRYIRQITKESIIFDSGDRISYPYRIYKSLKDEFLRFLISEEL